MAKKSIPRKRKKGNRKKWVATSQAGLCAMGEVLLFVMYFAAA